MYFKNKPFIRKIWKKKIFLNVTIIATYVAKNKYNA